MWARSEGGDTKLEWVPARVYESGKELRITGGCTSVESNGAGAGDFIQTERRVELTLSEADLVDLFEYCLAEGIVSFTPSISASE
jgi:hypothetical protein